MGTARGDDAAAVAFVGGRVRTMDPARPEAAVVVVRDGRIAAVGGVGLERAHPDAVVHDLGGRLLVPGFIDAHCHLSVAALRPTWGDASTCADADALGAVIRAQAARFPDDTWIRLDGWDETATGLRLDRHTLDAVAGDRPCLVAHNTFHQGVVSSAGLDALGIGRGTGALGLDRDDDAAHVVRAADGTPTGLLVERAFGRAHSASMADVDDPDRWDDWVVAHATRLRAMGITAVHDAACDAATEAMYARLRRAGRLPVSVLALPHPAPFLHNELAARLDGPPTGEGDALLRVGPIKLFADGGVLPAIDVHVGGAPMAFGYRYPDLADRLVEAVGRGFRVAVHAMGNRGVADAVAAFGAAARRHPADDHRFRVEHAGMAGPADAAALAALGAVGVVQPGFVEHVARNAAGFEPDDADWLPFGTLDAAGVPLAGSSDDPCGPVAPMACAHLGATRRTHAGQLFGVSQALPLDRWLEAYTRGAAYAGGQEHERGTIAPGLLADLVVLDDVGSTPSPTISGAGPTIAETWIDGRRVR
ncbi:MAG: amidohydrolase family protein [Acidimicrobiales bacterium]|nr:amidohydrolase family protein [Acidimicrobiales bacterium]